MTETAPTAGAGVGVDSLGELALKGDLAAAPWDYPGAWAPYSGLLAGAHFSRLLPGGSQGLGGSRLTTEPDEGGADQRTIALDVALLAADVAPAGDRAVVVAVGTNAAPAVLRRKLKKGGVSGVVPLFAGLLHGVAVGHSAHVSAAGYLAAAPHRAAETATRVFALLLDSSQRACLDETEPNYVRRLVSAARCRLELTIGEEPDSFHLYDSTWGVVAEPGGPPMPLRSQEETLRHLQARWTRYPDLLGDTHDPRVLLTRLASRERLRSEVRDALHATGWTTASGLADVE